MNPLDGSETHESVTKLVLPTRGSTGSPGCA